MEIYIPKKTLILNSHGLSDYQKCPQLFGYTNIQNLEPAMTYLPFAKGTLISTLLERYYTLQINDKLNKDNVWNVIQTTLYNESNPIRDDKELMPFLEMRMLQYWKFYQKESWVTIAVEEGYSKTIYEDDSHLFVYEGRPDWTGYIDKEMNKLVHADHKSQSRHDNIYPFNNQALGYCWASEIDIFIYNYFGLQTTGKPEDWFRRVPQRFSKQQIETWQNETIQWFFKILKDRERLKSWQCTGKYGVCAYKKLCEASEDWIRKDLINREFKSRHYQSWEVKDEALPHLSTDQE